MFGIQKTWASLSQSVSGPPRRRKGADSYKAVGVVADYRLEPRCCMTAGIGAMAANAATAAPQLGEIRWTSGPIGIDDIRTAVANPANNQWYVAGNSPDGVRVPITPNLTDGTARVGSVEEFWDLAFAGGSPVNDPRIHGSTPLQNGALLFLGEGLNSNGIDTATSWLSPHQPLGASNNQSIASVLSSGLPTGEVGGFFDGRASVGTTALQTLPHAPLGSAILDMDSIWAVGGGGIWKQLGEGNFTKIDTAGWDAGPIGVPELFRGVSSIGTTVSVAADHLMEDFTPIVRVWDPNRSTDNLRGITLPGDTLADLDVIEGQTVLVVNNLTSGAALYVNNDFTHRIELSEMFGEGVYAIPNTLFQDELGLVIQRGGTARAVSIDFLTEAGVTFDPVSGALTVVLSGRGSAVLASNSAGQVLFNGELVSHEGNAVRASAVRSLEVIGGDGGNRIDLSRLSTSRFSGLRRSGPSDPRGIAVRVNAGAGSDTVIGSPLADQIFGEAGNDSLTGNSGDDSLSGGADNDTLNGGLGTDTLHESANVNFTLTSSKLMGLGTDKLSSLQRADLTGGNGNNALNATRFPGAVTLHGGDGNDTLLGGTANDRLDAGAGNDSVSGGSGNDLLLGGSGHDFLSGDSGHDTLVGDSGQDTLQGGLGNDLSLGGADDDRLSDTLGRNTLAGNHGTDTVVGNRLSRIDDAFAFDLEALLF